MFGDRFVRATHHVLIAAIVVMSMAALSAQTVVDPRYVEFNASPDHNAVVSGIPIVTGYSLTIYPVGSPNAFATLSLGKPTPNSSNVIRVDFLPLLDVLPTPGLLFEARVSATGPGGAGNSTVSNSFSFSPACATPSISPTSRSVSSAATTGSVSVTSTTGCGWAAASNSTWITLTGATSGMGNGVVPYSVAANPSTAQRIGSVTIGDDIFTVTQAGTPCTYSLSPGSQTIAAAGGPGSTSITAPAGCAWTATSNAGWVTLQGSTSGSGNGSASFDIAPNPNATQRTGTLTIGGQTFSITQSAAACTYSISPGGQSVGAGATTGSTTVTSPTGCSWTSTSNAGWITVTAGASGSGNGSASFSIAANPNATPRNGTVTVANQTFTVSQAAVGCTFTLTPGSQAVAAGGGTGSTNVGAPAGCAWTAASSAPSWLSITSATSGSGNGSVSFSATANTNTQPRSGTLTIGGQTFTVNQSAGSCTFSISPTTLSTAATGGTGTTNVTTTSSCAWTATSNASWIDITAGASRTGSGSVSFTVEANNTASERTGTLTAAGRTFTVTQAGNPCTYNLIPTSRTMPARQSSSSSFVSTAANCSWTATSQASWITTNSSDTGSTSLTFTVTVNSTGSTRTGTIRVGGATLTITQPSATIPTAPRNLRVVVVTGGS
jgi:hypothetical protein